MRVFEFIDYKAFVNARIHALPNRGRGQFQKIAAHLRIHSTLVSQVFSGKRDLTCEQGCELAEYLGLNQLETDYFLNLLNEARSGSVKLSLNLKRQRAKLLQQAKALSSHFPKGKALDEGEQAIYYSQWYFSAVWLLAQVPGYETADAIAGQLKLSQGVTRHVVDYLVSVGLLSEKKGKLHSELDWMIVPSHSHHVFRHHANWRLKALESLPNRKENEFSFTGPITLSVQDCSTVRTLIEALVSKVSKTVQESPSETLMCLNIDFFDPR